MSSSESARTAARGIRSGVAVVIGVALVAAAIVAILGSQLSAVSFPSSASDPGPLDAPALAEDPGADRGGDLGADGDVADDVTVFDDGVPAVANLDPDLLEALRRAATDAAGDGVTFFVNSGWRSPEYQDRLLQDAVAEYDSAAEAARWVATADTSPHVQGDAVDIGQWDATDWLAEHGAEYGLCQIYANEPWHYELRTEAGDRGCPPMYADAAHDPRLQRRG